MADCIEVIAEKPTTVQLPTNIYGIPLGNPGRWVGGDEAQIEKIALHCLFTKIDKLDTEMRFKTSSSISEGEYHNSFHYGVGNVGYVRQYVKDSNIAWSYGEYKFLPLTVLATDEDPTSINIAIAIDLVAAELKEGCLSCCTSSGLSEIQHDKLLDLLLYLTYTYGLDIVESTFTTHADDNCPCVDITDLVNDLNQKCAECLEGQSVNDFPQITETGKVVELLGIVESCCDSGVQCMARVPLDLCCVTSALTESPLTGDGSEGNAIGFDSCAWGQSLAPGTANQIVALDATGCPVLTDVPSFQADFCATIPSALEPLYLAGKDVGENCPVLFTPDQIVNAGFNVANTASVTLSFVNNILQADVVPDVVVAAGLLAQDTATLDLTLTGNALTGDVISDQVVADGLEVLDTSTLDLSLAGNVLSGDVIASQVVTDGLIVQDTPTVDLTLVGNTLSADVISVDGILTVQDTATIDLTLVGDVLSADLVSAPTTLTVQDSDTVTLTLVDDVLTAEVNVAGLSALACCSPYGTAPEAAVADQGDPSIDPAPTGFATWDDYFAYKCEAANKTVDDWVTSLNNLASLEGMLDSIQPDSLGDFLHASLSGGILVGVPLTGYGVGTYAALVIQSLIDLLGAGSQHYAYFSALGAAVDADKETLICDLYEATSVSAAQTAIVSFLAAKALGLTYDPGDDDALFQATVADLGNNLANNTPTNDLFTYNASIDGYAGSVVDCETTCVSQLP